MSPSAAYYKWWLRTINGGKRKAQKVVSEGVPKDVEATDPMPVTEVSGCESVSGDSDPFSHDSDGEPDARAVTLPFPVAEAELSAPVEEDVPPGLLSRGKQPKSGPGFQRRAAHRLWHLESNRRKGQAEL